LIANGIISISIWSVKEAEQYNYTPEDVQVALKMCADKNPLQWLQVSLNCFHIGVIDYTVIPRGIYIACKSSLQT